MGVEYDATWTHLMKEVTRIEELYRNVKQLCFVYRFQDNVVWWRRCIHHDHIQLEIY